MNTYYNLQLEKCVLTNKQWEDRLNRLRSFDRVEGSTLNFRIWSRGLTEQFKGFDKKRVCRSKSKRELCIEILMQEFDNLRSYSSPAGYEIHLNGLTYNVYDSNTGECLNRRHAFKTMSSAKNWIDDKMESEQE